MKGQRNKILEKIDDPDDQLDNGWSTEEEDFEDEESSIMDLHCTSQTTTKLFGKAKKSRGRRTNNQTREEEAI